MMDGKTNRAKQEENDENMERDSRSQLILQFGQKGTFSIKQETEETKDRGCTDIQSQSNSCPVLPLTEGELLTTTEGKEERSQQQKGFQVYLIKQELKEEPSCHETENEKCQQQTSEGDLQEDNRQGPVEEERLQTSQPTSESGAESFRDTHSTVQNSGNGKSFTENSHLSSNVSKRNLEEVKTQGGKCSQVDNALPPKTVTCSLDRYLSRPYRCTQCKHRFRNSSNLKQHMYIHLGEKPYECCKCEEVFFTQRDRNNHYKQSHRDVSVCECGEVFSGSEGFPFSSEVELVIHKKSHDMKNFHQCSRCQKLIPGDIDVSKLGAIHNINRPYCSGYVKLLCSKSCLARMTGKQQKEKAREGLSKTKTDERCTEKRQVCSESEYKLVTGESSQEVCCRHDREFPTAFSSNERTEPNKDCFEFFNVESERVITTENDDTSTEHMRIGNGSEQNLELTETIGEECTRFNIGSLYSQTALSNNVKMETNQNESHMFIDPDGILRNTEDNSTCAEHIRTGNGSEHNIETIETIAGEECSEFSHLGTPANAALSSDIKIDPNENEDYGFIDTGDILRNSEDSETYSEDKRMGNESEQSIETRESIGEECNEFDNVGNSANVAMFTCSNKEIEPCENEGYRLIDPGEVLRNIEDNATYTEYKKTGNDTEQNIETRDTIGEECNGFNVLPNVQAALSSNERMEQSENQHGSKSVKKPYLCPVCTYSFRDSADLKDHLYSHTGEKPYICSKCNKGFTRERTLKSHLAMIHGLNSSKKDLIIHNRVAEVEEMFQCYINKRLVKHHKCTVCDRVFTSQRLLKAHMRKKHKMTGTFPCFLCQEKFPTEQDWSGHMQLHTDQNPPNECYETSHESGDEAASTSVTNEAKLCNNGSETGIAESENEEAKLSKVASTSDMPRPISTKSVKKPYPCPVCNRRFRKSSHRKDHMLTHTGERPFVCPECLKGFTRRTFLISHFNQEHKDLFICECMETFSSEVKLCMHKGSRSKANSYKCCKCEREFENRIALGTHFATHIENRYICSICKQTFGMNHQLLAHMKMHQMEGSHQGLSSDNDQTCTKNIELSTDNVNKTNLQETETKGGGGNKANMYSTYDLPILLGTKGVEKPYSCHVCKNGFSTKSSLKEHMYTHTTELPYKCSECAESFRRGSNMRHHFTTKHADLNICDCGERFSSKLDLSIHKRTQINANPNICCKCGVECKNKASLNIHLTRHLLRRKHHNCPQCDKAFSWKTQLQAHMKTHKIEGTHQYFLSKKIFPSKRHCQEDMSVHKNENSSNINLEDCSNSNPKSCNFTEHAPERNSEANETNVDARRTVTEEWNRFDMGPYAQTALSSNERLETNENQSNWLNDICEKLGDSASNEVCTVHIELDNEVSKANPAENKVNMASKSNIRGLSSKSVFKKLYSCPVCTKSFRDTTDLKDHLYTHTEERPYICSKCNKGFNRKRTLKKHLAMLHGHISFQEDLIIHNRIDKVEEMFQCCMNKQLVKHYKCTVCDLVFTSQHMLKAHMEKKHKTTGTFPCFLCQEKFPTEQDWSRHMQLHTDQNPPKDCSEPSHESGDEAASTSVTNEAKLCNNGSETGIAESENEEAKQSNMASTSDMPRPISTKSVKKPYPCPVCNRRFRKSSHLKDHMFTHTGERPFVCPECLKGFTRRTFLISHFNQEHKDLFICECMETFSSEVELCMHKGSHSKANSYKCCKCEREFENRIALGTHFATHIENRYICSICKQTFGMNHQLLAHMKMHQMEGSHQGLSNDNDQRCTKNIELSTNANKTNLQETETKNGEGNQTNMYATYNLPILLGIKVLEKPYSCHVCKNGFSTKSSLKEHMYTHTTELPYKCSECAESFRRGSNLRHHYASKHADLNICDCGERFSSQLDLGIHKRTQINANPNICCKCGFECKNKAALNIHLTKHFVRRKGQLQALMERHKIEGTHCFLSKEISPLNRHRQQHISLHADENSSNMNLEDSFNSNPKLCYFTEHGSEGNREMNQTNLEARETREDKSNNALTHEIPRPQSENSAEKQHVCPVCNKRFRKSSHMKEHMYTHTGDKRFGCSQCKKRFTRNRALMHHLLKQHKDIPICECGEKFSSEAELISHQDTHECRTYAEKQLACPVCNKIMRSNYRLKEHMYVHTREKPFECPQCGTRFTRRHGLLVHITHNHKHISTHKIREILTSQAQLLSQKQIHSHTSSGNVQETPDKHNEQCPTHEDCTKDIDTDPNRSLLDYSMGDSILPSINSHQRLNNIENGETCTEATEYGNNISEFNLEAERKESDMTSSSNSDILCGLQSEMSVKEEISCSKCHKQFATQQYLARHMNEHMLGHGYRCSECEMICGSKLDMSRHLRTHTGGRPHQCPECGIRFVTKLRMTQHMTRKHPPQALHLCNICGRRLRSQQSLLYHIKSHEREPCHKCPECGEGFRHKVDLSRHLVACTGGKPHQCPHCQERFGDKWEFNRHVKVHLGKGSRCTICNRECRTPWHLAGHMRRHYGEKPFECPQCKMRMVDKSSFNVHLRTHTGERPYKCFNCNKTFPTSSGRARHLRKVHKDFQVFRCDICDQRFSSRVDRISHKKKVLGEMPHQCLDCDQKFACMCDLTVHMRTHNG